MDNNLQQTQLLSPDGLRSLLESLPTTNSGEGSTALAKELANSTPPSVLYKQYSPELQGLLDGRVHDISALSGRAGVPMLCEVADAYGNQGVAVDWIKAHLEVVNGFANVQQRLNTEQLMAIGEQIYGMYPELNLLEFALFCGRLKRGRYEKWYGAVDGQKILISLDAFMSDRRADIVRKQEEEHRKLRAQEAATPGVDPAELIRSHPGKYPTLEKLINGGGIYKNITRRITKEKKK